VVFLIRWLETAALRKRIESTSVVIIIIIIIITEMTISLECVVQETIVQEAQN